MERSEIPTIELSLARVAYGSEHIASNVFCATSGISLGSLWEVLGKLLNSWNFIFNFKSERNRYAQKEIQKLSWGDYCDREEWMQFKMELDEEIKKRKEVQAD